MLFSVKLACLHIQRGYHAICYLFSHQLNSKKNFVLLYDLMALKLLIPVVFCNEWWGSCHGHGMKLSQRYQVFFFAYKNHKKVVSAS